MITAGIEQAACRALLFTSMIDVPAVESCLVFGLGLPFTWVFIQLVALSVATLIKLLLLVFSAPATTLARVRPSSLLTFAIIR